MPVKPAESALPADAKAQAPASREPVGALAKAAGRFSAATMLSRVLGLAREQLFAILVGAGEFADAFVVAFRIPNLLRDLFAEGALSAAFVPTFTDYLTHRRREEAWRLANRVINTLLLVLGLLVLAGTLWSEHLVQILAGQFPPVQVARASRLTRIMLPFLPVVSLAAVAMGMLTSQKRFGAPALAPAMFNVVAIGAGGALWAFGATPETAIVGWSVGTLLGGLAQLLVQLPALRATGWRYSLSFDPTFRDPGLRRIGRLMGPATVGLAATQVNIVVNTYFASGVVGAAAWLSYAFRLMQLPIGVFGVAVATVSMASVAQKAAVRDLPGVDRTLGTGLRLVAFLTVPSTLALMVLGEPIVRLIFEHGRFRPEDTRYTALALLFYSVGLFAYAAVKVLAPAFYALDRARTPLAASLTAVGANIALNLLAFPLLAGRFGAPFAGAALALGTSVAAITNFAVLLVAYRRLGGGLAGEKLWGHLARVFSASVVAAAGAYAAARLSASLLGHERLAARMAETVGGLTVGSVLYFATCRALRVDELTTFLAALRRRFGTRPPA